MLGTDDPRAQSRAANPNKVRALRSQLGAGGFRLLGALALESALSNDVLLQLTDKPATFASFSREALKRGLLNTDMKFSRLGRGQHGLAIAGGLRQLVIRELGRSGELDPLVRDCHRLVGTRSQAPLELALQLGDLNAFTKLSASQPTGLRGLVRSPDAWIRESVCEAFDAEWFSGVWGEGALDIAERIVRESVGRLEPLGGLERWFVEAATQQRDAASRQRTLALWLEQAALRGDVEGLKRLSRELSPTARVIFDACESFIRGDSGRVAALLELLFDSKKKPNAVEAGCLVVVPALLRVGLGTPEAFAEARRLVGSGKRSDLKAASRAFKALLGFLTEPDIKQRRVDVYALARSGSFWELLLSGVAVELHTEQPVTRAAWAVQLVQAALMWRAAGYTWIARQGFGLARRFDEAQASDELRRHELLWEDVERPGELFLWSGISVKSEWEKALQRLGQVSEQLQKTTERQYRVAWFVDMADGELARPALQEFRGDMGTWTQGRRMSWAELYDYRSKLPVEDQRVVECSRELPGGQREPTAEAAEALIGHPRVFNGARAMLPVSVLPGRARIETHEQSGYIQITAEPQGAEVGVNVSVEAEDRLRVYRVNEDMGRVMDALPHGVRIPKAQEAALLEVLSKLSMSVDVVSPELGVEQEVEADSTPVVRAALHAGAWLVQFGVRPFSDGGRFFVAGEGTPRIKAFHAGRRLRSLRNLRDERERTDALIAVCPSLPLVDDEVRSPLDPPDSWVLGEEGLLCLLSDLSRCGVAHRFEWPERGGLRLRGTASSLSLKGQLRCIKGWYLAQGEVKLSDVDQVALEALTRASPIGLGRFVRLDTGDYVEVEEKVRRILAALKSASLTPKKAGKDPEVPGGAFQVYRGALSTLRHLADPDSGFEVDAEVRDWLERVQIALTEGHAVPAGLNAELREYQRAGYVWLSRLAELGLGACLADDMGLGKTLQIIGLLLQRRRPTLVVAPTSVCVNWVNELNRFAPELRVMEYLSKARRQQLKRFLEKGPGVVIASYGLLQQDAEQLGEVEWDTVVLDEAQFIKNATSLRAKAAFGLKADVRIVATGTPLENHLGDVWSIFRFLNPGLLGEWKNFRREFLRPIEQDQDEEARVELRQRLEPYILRRRKAEVLKELPPITDILHEVRFSEAEMMRYGLLRKQVHEKLFTFAGKRDNKLEILAEITRLRRFCCHPRLVFPDAPYECSKIDAFLDLAEELAENGHRALVFSQFVDFLALVREQLEERRLSYEYLDGSVPKASRQRRVDAFQSGSAPLFLISLKAGGFGLNLTAADYVIHLDPWWNPAVEAQATDRAHRIGQEKPVTVYRLLMKHSIEQSVTELHARKRELAAALLDGSERVATLDADELVKLVSLGPR
ncbi:MAG: DEAD/DEAH box helicase [Polyangiaceae bacterium]|nr:DEAD/DEAH box helicase [Polyangiaceae bacterium]